MNNSFIFQEIRKYNQATDQRRKDLALSAIGLHAGLLEKKHIALRDLTFEERSRVIYFLEQFLKQQKLEVAIKQFSHNEGTA